MEFLVNIDKGTYDVKVLNGDESYLKNNRQLSLEGSMVDTTAGNSTLANIRSHSQRRPSHLRIIALPGSPYDYAVINALTITTAAPV